MKIPGYPAMRSPRSLKWTKAFWISLSRILKPTWLANTSAEYFGQISEDMHILFLSVSRILSFYSLSFCLTVILSLSDLHTGVLCAEYRTVSTYSQAGHKTDFEFKFLFFYLVCGVVLEMREKYITYFSSPSMCTNYSKARHCYAAVVQKMDTQPLVPSVQFVYLQFPKIKVKMYFRSSRT